eukprot:4281672-Amphidinium_carterae.1
MPCSANDMAALRQQLASLEVKLGGKPAGTQQPNKEGENRTRRGGGSASQDESAGWYCMNFMFFYKGFMLSCLHCEWAWTQEEVPGKPVPPQPAPALESLLKKHLAVA